MKKIALTRGKVALVDDEDFETLSCHKWCADKKGRTWYAVRRPGPGRANVLMHSAIAGTPAGMTTDHIDGDGLNNTRANLRVCTKGQNRQNQTRKIERCTSRFRGAHWDPVNRKWISSIRVCGIKKYLGRFSTEFEAAGAYDAAGIERDPEYFTPNFSASWLAPVSA